MSHGVAPHLQVTDLVAGYVRGLPVVHGVSIEVDRREIVTLIGPNGAGKSTLLKAIAGLIASEKGRIRLGGRDVTALPAHRVVSSGIGFVPQTGNVFTTLTVHENLKVGAHLVRGSLNERLERAYALFPPLAARRPLRARAMSGGERQMLAIARAVMADPTLLMLDEPTAGLAPRVVEEVFRQLRGLAAIGVTFTLGIMRFANFAHSELLTWGAYIALVVVAFAGPGTPTGPLSFGWQLLAAALVAAVLTGFAAWAVDVLVFRRLRRRGALPLTMVFAAFGAALVMRHLIVLIWGHESRYYTRELQLAVELLPGARMLPDQIFILGLALAAMIVLHAFLSWSRTGIAMRAMAESPALAQVCGVEVDAVVRLTWIISGALAAFAGVFTGLTPQLHPEIGFNLLLSLFAAAILGGTGSLAGAVIGGVRVGLCG